MQLLPKRTKAAFLMSAADLFEQAKEDGNKVYFWTFTWPQPMHDWCYAKSWNRFQEELVRKHTSETFAMLHAWERHPGGHGLHKHALCNERLPVNLLRRLAVWAGMGKVLHVRRAHQGPHMFKGKLYGGDDDYLAKYMGKEDGKLFHIKRWGKAGNWTHTQCRDLEFRSEEADCFRASYKLLRGMGRDHATAFVETTNHVRNYYDSRTD